MKFVDSFQALTNVQLTSSCPPQVLVLLSHLFLVKPACLDFAVTHAQQPSVIQSASKVTAAAAERYENKVKYPRYGKSCADNNLVFVPMIVEAHGAWGPSSKKVFKFVTKAAAYSTRASSDRAASHLLQNLSVVLQRQNVLTILKHHPPPDLDSPIPEFSPSSVPFSSTSSPPSSTVSSSQSSVSTLSQSSSSSSSSSSSCGSRNSSSRCNSNSISKKEIKNSNSIRNGNSSRQNSLQSTHSNMSCVKSVSVCSPLFCLPPRPHPLLPHPTKSPRPHPHLSHTTNSSYPFSSFSSPTPTHMSPVAWYHSPSDDIWKPKKSKPPVPFPITSSFLSSSSSPVLRTPPPTRHFSSDLFSPKLRKLSKKSNDYIKLTSACETVVKQSHVNHNGTGQSSDAA